MRPAKLTTLMNLFISIDRLLQEQMRKDDGSPPFSLMDYAVIELIEGLEEPPTMRDIARFLDVTPPAVTGIVDRLARKKAVKRMPNKKDRRRVQLCVTALGKKQHATNLQLLKKKIEEPFKVLSDNDVGTLIRILEKLTTSNK